MKKSILCCLSALTFLISSIVLIDIASAVMPLPTDRESWSYPPIEIPNPDDDPSKAKPVAVGSIAIGGSMLSIKVVLNQFGASVDIWGAFTRSADPTKVYILNPDGTTFSVFTMDEIITALSTKTPPQGADPWITNTLGPINNQLFNISVSDIASGVYNVYLLISPVGDLNNYYLWTTSFLLESGAIIPLEPETIPHFIDPLVIPPVMKPEGSENGTTLYKIAVRQFNQKVLPTGFPKTTVWGYGRKGDPLPGEGVTSSFNFPAFTVEARTNERVRVNWINQLVDDPDISDPLFLPHLLPVDQTLHWANPLGPADTKGTDTNPYLGPVPIVTHVHGAHVPDISDGFPEAWYLPNASNIPDGYLTQGTHYGSVIPAESGEAIFEYPNDQRATTLWYHDHALGMTRLNVYAGMAGFWLLRDETEDNLNLPMPAPQLDDPPGTKYFEIPIAIQDRSFYDDGSLFYPDSRSFFDEYNGPFIPDTPVPPIWNPEFFGNTIVVNGRTWPYLEVEPRKYRFRFLNGCNSRFLILKFNKENLMFNQIGSEGGLLPEAPAVLDQLLMAPAERADVIVDFSKFNAGEKIVLLNIGPDEPFKGSDKKQEPADSRTTGVVMQFRVVELTTPDNSEIPTSLPPISSLETNLPSRDLTLNEEVYEAADIPIAALLGTGADGPLTWADAITENPMEGDTEIWRIINLTEDAHPVHLHLVMFQVIDRIPFDAEEYHEAQEEYIESGKIGTLPDPTDFTTGEAIEPNIWEMGWKDTVIANPGEITRIIATFDLAGLYVWHCHILEHEDNEMMRPYRVIPK
jgi:FtsP/CotA-like multicopper oxidase with cupredoxin domain